MNNPVQTHERCRRRSVDTVTRLWDGHDFQQRLKICVFSWSPGVIWISYSLPTEWVSFLNWPGLQVNRLCLVLRSGKHGDVTRHAQ